MEKDFKSKNYVWQGILLVVIGIPMAFLQGIGVLLIVLGLVFLLTNQVVLHIAADHLTFKGAPLAGKKYVLFNDIEETDYSERAILLKLKTGKKIRIPKTHFKQNDWDEINKTIKSIK